jgi:redox-sensitive bicupin YhaK (pirin superfamily)
MLDGHMRHEDHLGNRGDLTPGSVQWMTAGRGIVHSEMPQQQSGRMRGFQLWLNLPAKDKMQPASYRDLAPTDIPTFELGGGVRIKAIAGETTIAGRTVTGAIIRKYGTNPLYLDVELPADARFVLPIDAGFSAFVYPYEGSIRVGPEDDSKVVPTHSAGVLGAGDEIQIVAAGEAARFLLLAGNPLRETVVQYGPFVMNTEREIQQAIEDYQNGRLARA